MDFINLKTQQRRIKEQLDANIQKVLAHGNYIMGPEIKELGLTDSQMDLVLFLAESDDPELHVIFRRPQEAALSQVTTNEAYISFYTPRMGAPPKLAPHHFRFPHSRAGLFHDMVGLLRVLAYELPDRKITVQFGWPFHKSSAVKMSFASPFCSVHVPSALSRTSKPSLSV